MRKLALFIMVVVVFVIASYGMTYLVITGMLNGLAMVVGIFGG